MNTHNPHHTKSITFNPNPWTLSFRSMSKAFRINQNNAIIIIITSIVLGIGNQIGSNGPDILLRASENASEATQLMVALMVLGFVLVFGLLSVVIGTLWQAYLAVVGLKNAREESVSFSEAFQLALSRFWACLGVGAFTALVVLAFFIPSFIIIICTSIFSSLEIPALVALGWGLSVIAFITGGIFAIRFALARNLSLYALFDERLGVMESMKRSKALTNRRLVETFGMGFVNIVPFIGTLLSSCTLGEHFLQLKAYRDHDAPMPPIHYLTWLPALCLVILFLLFWMLIIAVLSISYS